MEMPILVSRRLCREHRRKNLDTDFRRAVIRTGCRCYCPRDGEISVEEKKQTGSAQFPLPEQPYLGVERDEVLVREKCYKIR